MRPPRGECRPESAQFFFERNVTRNRTAIEAQKSQILSTRVKKKRRKKKKKEKTTQNPEGRTPSSQSNLKQGSKCELDLKEFVVELFVSS